MDGVRDIAIEAVELYKITLELPGQQSADRHQRVNPPMAFFMLPVLAVVGAAADVASRRRWVRC